MLAILVITAVYFQVLSISFADALAYFGDPKTEEIEKFIRYFDKLFDRLNMQEEGEMTNLLYSEVFRMLVHCEFKISCSGSYTRNLLSKTSPV